jgi:hypothetical protein
MRTRILAAYKEEVCPLIYWEDFFALRFSCLFLFTLFHNVKQGTKSRLSSDEADYLRLERQIHNEQVFHLQIRQ